MRNVTSNTVSAKKPSYGHQPLRSKAWGELQKTRQTGPHTHVWRYIKNERACVSLQAITNDAPITKQHTQKHTYKYLAPPRPRHILGRGLWGGAAGGCRCSTWRRPSRLDPLRGSPSPPRIRHGNEGHAAGMYRAWRVAYSCGCGGWGMTKARHGGRASVVCCGRGWWLWGAAGHDDYVGVSVLGFGGVVVGACWVGVGVGDVFAGFGESGELFAAHGVGLVVGFGWGV